MSEERPSLQIDTDWKKQAQEEKRLLAEKEQEEKARQAAAPAPAVPEAAGLMPGEEPVPVGATAAAPSGPRGARDMPPTFETLVHQLLTQALFYLGELAHRGMEPVVNLDMARHQVDILTMLEQKTQNNLTAEEKRAIDSALYEARMRFVSVASQYL